jgi:SHS2 domain-containing protein
VEFGEAVLKMRCWGEKMDPGRHELRGGVKAATYHMLAVQRGVPSKVQVIFDV